MKKLLVLLVLLGLGSMVYAQGISFGLNGGLNIPKVTGADVSVYLDNLKSNNGIVAGAYVSIGLLPNISIQPEMLYSQKGFKTSYDFYGERHEQTLRINYMEIPVLAKLSFGAIIKPYVLAGPYLATKIGTNYEETIDGIMYISTNENGLAGLDIGLTVGAGIQTPIKISVEARYSMGLRSIYYGSELDDLDIKNSNIQLLVGYTIF